MSGPAMVYKGFRFGMLLQLSVGPVCLFVLQTAGTAGLPAALTVVLAVALVDAAYILLAGTGEAALLNRGGVQRVLRILGFTLLLLFGLNMALGAFGAALLPEIHLLSGAQPDSFFVQGILLTASNPLTILFWSGVFASQAADRLDRRQLLGFGLGCVLSTLVFLTGVAALGRALGSLLPAPVVAGLNAFVGLLIIAFGIKLLIKKST